jgi:excinuclease UvrABC ATPase subunit
LPEPALQSRNACGEVQGIFDFELLETTVIEALQILENIPQIRASRRWPTLGWDTFTWDNPPRPSGGEAQRIKLAKELSRRHGKDTSHPG